MNYFNYRNGILHAEEVSLDRLADDVGTPFYCYSTAILKHNFQILQDAVSDLDTIICFSIKANSNIAVIKTLATYGAGADVVSEGELRRAITAGIPSERIVFSGVGKTRRELEFAVDNNILQINVESESELEDLNAVALARGSFVKIGLRINPDINVNTHEKITTGRKENKFGIEWPRNLQILRNINDLPNIEVVSIAIHIGSQLTDLQFFRDSFKYLRNFVLMLRDEGIFIKRLDLGGGLGISYDDSTTIPTPVDYVEIIRENLGDLGCHLILEPGRMLVADAGLLVSRVIHVKQGTTRNFIICDAAMNDLVRPAMYEAYHEILPVIKPAVGHKKCLTDVVGPICESSDTFAKQRLLPPFVRNDLLVFVTTGAYGSSMASTYNSRQLIPEVLVKKNQFSIVRTRPTYENMLMMESFPPWL
ncbi:MAG: diaminopimelate decarboxylase [Rhodospirillaceae bacterium]|jgi:diaminopimelate decarboxylase|nr:diaminopimelate decarboxylase [Rhodospirillaceae bacterium]